MCFGSFKETTKREGLFEKELRDQREKEKTVKQYMKRIKIGRPEDHLQTQHSAQRGKEPYRR